MNCNCQAQDGFGMTMPCSFHVKWLESATTPLKAEIARSHAEVDQKSAYIQELTGAVEDLRRQNGAALLQYREAVEKIERARTWSKLDSAGCVLCTYVEGVFVTPCAYHREMEEMNRLIEVLQKEIAAARDIMSGNGDKKDPAYSGWYNRTREMDFDQLKKAQRF